MGCLNVQITNETLRDVTINALQCNTNVSTSVYNHNVPLTIHAARERYVIHTDLENGNTVISITAQNKNKKISILAGLVCDVSLDKYEVLFVDDGPLMVEEGYLKVKKRHYE